MRGFVSHGILFWIHSRFCMLVRAVGRLNHQLHSYHKTIHPLWPHYFCKVTQTGVGIHAAGQPRHRRRLRPGPEIAEGDFLSGSHWGIGRGGTRERGYLPVSETGMTGPSETEYDVPWNMDNSLCHHRTPCRSAQGPGGVPDGGPLGLPLRGADIGL